MQRTVNERPHTPWWCKKLDDMKRRVRLSERKWRQNRTDNYRNCYIELRDQYCRTLASTKAAFYSKVIETASNRITNRLLGRKCGNTLPNEIGGPAIIADRFASHFTDKIDSIRCQIPMPSANIYNAHARVVLSPLLAFQPASLEELTSLIQNVKIKTSNIDPLPSAILKANTSILAPILRSIINLSYESSTVPASMKHAVITPHLKRSGLSADDYSSY